MRIVLCEGMSRSWRVQLGEHYSDEDRSMRKSKPKKSEPRTTRFVLDTTPGQSVEHLSRQIAVRKDFEGDWSPVYPRSFVLVPVPNDEKDSKRARVTVDLDWEAQAMAFVYRNPESTVQAIADAVGVHRGTLYRSDTFKEFRKRFQQMLREESLQLLPRGQIERRGDDQRLEAFSHDSTRERASLLSD
jgi:hypothetical protein